MENQQQHSPQPSLPLVPHSNNQASNLYSGDADHGQGHAFTSPQCNKNYNYQYYEEFKKLYLTSYCLSIQLKKIMKTKDEVVAKLTKIQKKTEEETKEESKGEAADKRKRVRRTADEIERKFYCTAERCGRNYGSEGSLQQHIKLKHPELYQERLRENGEHLPESIHESQ